MGAEWAVAVAARRIDSSSRSGAALFARKAQARGRGALTRPGTAYRMKRVTTSQAPPPPSPRAAIARGSRAGPRPDGRSLPLRPKHFKEQECTALRSASDCGISPQSGVLRPQPRKLFRFGLFSGSRWARTPKSTAPRYYSKTTQPPLTRPSCPRRCSRRHDAGTRRKRLSRTNGASRAPAHDKHRRPDPVHRYPSHSALLETVLREAIVYPGLDTTQGGNVADRERPRIQILQGRDHHRTRLAQPLAVTRAPVNLIGLGRIPNRHIQHLARRHIHTRHLHVGNPVPDSERRQPVTDP